MLKYIPFLLHHHYRYLLCTCVFECVLHSRSSHLQLGGVRGLRFSHAMEAQITRDAVQRPDTRGRLRFICFVFSLLEHVGYKGSCFCFAVARGSEYKTGNGQCMPLCGAFLVMALFGVSKSDSTVEGSASSAGGAGSVSKEDHFDALDAFDQLVFDQGAICVDVPESTSSERHVQQSSVCPLADITSEQSAGIPLTDKVGEQHSGEDDKPVQTVPIPRFKRLPNGEICGSRVARQARAEQAAQALAKGKCKGKAKTKAKVSPSKIGKFASKRVRSKQSPN